MDKYKKLLDILCNKYNYRFFTGVPNNELADFFNSLVSNILHFVPTIDDSISIYMASGVALTGEKPTVICGENTIDKNLDFIENYIVKYNLKVLFLSTKEYKNLSFKSFEYSDMDDMVKYMEKESLPALLII